ncbi:C-type lectin domain family 10 member A-like isoform X2 [Micropterus salmoides]|uniref:C-type lectin domain family 10 member A-like isoform X2 n=1 Tax=Micropterus salmoides TaxID=27706 RepID=UPI0018EAA0B9|nr:C-type lectin domain family 10 member A-like isoform X2 [Micropterus salmoides]
MQRDREGDTNMTTEYHDDVEEDASSFWNKEPRPVSFSGVSRFRPWLFPALTATVILVLIIALGASNSNTSNQLWSVENTVSNLTESMSAVQQLTKDAAKDVHRLKFAVESNKDQLTSVSEELKQLSALDSIRRSVAMLKCSLERIIHNSSVVDGCCPLEWDIFGTSCYFFSQTTLSWDKARDWCSAHGSHLVILNSDDEWAFVTRHTLGIFYWVGLTDERTGRWEWVNQTPYIMNRRRWAPGQPDNWNGHGLGPGGEDCAHLFPDGRLNDQHCSIKMRFVCQKHSLRV